MPWDARDYADRLREAFPPVTPTEVVSPLAKDVKPLGCERMVGAVKGKNWLEIPPEEAMSVAPEIITLTTEALGCLLPAFLKGAAMDLEGEGSTYVFYALAPLDQIDTYYERTCELFTHQQAALIAELLEQMASAPSFSYFGDEPETAKALWLRRAEGG